LYNTTAFLYEATAAFEAPERTCDEIEGFLADCGIKSPGLLGDLGSGTGLMSVLLAERGWQVEGIELSPAMLAVAQAKSRMLPAPVRERIVWRQGDISRFEVGSGKLWDAAVCLCNTINHLAEWEQVKSFSSAVFQALKPGGALILDSDTLDTFQGFFHHGPVVVWDDGTHRMTRACEFNADSGRASHTATLEEYVPSGLRLLSRESMALQYHRETELFILFNQVGFQLAQAVPYNPCPNLYRGFVPKLLWILQKP